MNARHALPVTPAVEAKSLPAMEEAYRLSPIVRRRVTARDLTGFGGTVLVVPAGQVAVQVDGQGDKQILASGRHKVRNPLSGPLPATVLISLSPLTLSTHVAGILAGGTAGELVDGDLHYGLQVADPALFFEAVGRRQPEVRASDLARWLEPRIQAALTPLLRHYAVSDLVSGGLAVEIILGQFQTTLAASLTEYGLALKWVQKPVFYRAEDAVLQAQRARELQQKLHQVGEGVGEKAKGYFARLGAGDASQLTPASLQHANAIFCRHVSAELTRLSGMAQEARSLVYRNGDTQLALRLKALQRQIETATAELTQAQPVYLHDLGLPLSDLQRALGNEDALLARVQALADEARTVLGEVLAGKETASRWAEVEAQLTAVRHELAARSRLLQAGAGQP